MAGDASRFMRRDAVEASWAWITEILEGWHRQGSGGYLNIGGTCGRSRPIASLKKMDGHGELVATHFMSAATA